MSEENFSDDAFKSQLDIESLLLMHINRIAINRDTNLKQYCSSVETLILLCPRFIREKAMQQVHDMGLHRGDYSNITDEKRVQYDDLFMYISELLEKQRMIWRKRSVRTFA